MAQPSGDLRQTLMGTLSPHVDTRRNAEKSLEAATKNPAHPLQVLQLIANSDAADLNIRQCAAVHFKNLVKKGWDENNENGTDGIVIQQQDRATIKTHLVELMCTVPPQIQAQISEAISLIAIVDYPAKWDNLLPELVQKFNSTDMNVLCGVLKTANSIFKRFRYVARSDDLYRVILYTLERIQEPLLALFISLGRAVEAYGNDAQQLKPRFDALRSICRIFYSLNYQDLPEFFEDHMSEWMTEFAKYLRYKNPLLTDNDEEMEPSPIDKLQAAVVQNLAHYADKDEEPFLPFLGNFTTLVWDLVINLTPLSKHDTLVTTSIKFLSSLVAKLMHKQLFQEEATLRQIITMIVIPNLMIREVDEERFEDDPHDYLLTEVEGSDSESRRKCSQDLLRAMCRQFEAETTKICSEHVGSMLAEFAKDNSKWAAKDAAIHLMLGISIRRENKMGVTAVNDAVNVMDFFNTHVFPELQDGNHANRPMVKTTAIKFVCTFRQQFSKEQTVALLPLLIAHLSSPSVVVHTFAAYAIERMLMTRDVDAAGVKRTRLTVNELQPFLEILFTSLFQLVENVDYDENDYVMKCIMRSLATAGEKIIPITGIVFEKLSGALARVCKNPRKPQFNHYLFESIAVLVRSVCSKDPNQTSQLEALLFPPFQTVLQMEIAEFTPYVFQVLAQLLEYRPQGSGLGESYSMLFPPLLSPVLWERRGNIPALVRLVEAYLKKAGEELARQHTQGILGIFQKLVASKANEVYGFDHLKSITLNIPPAVLSPYMKTVFEILLRRLQSGRTPKYVRLMTQYFALFIGKFGAAKFFDTMNSIQQGVAFNILGQVWIPRLKTDAPSRLDAKIQVVGLTRLLTDTPALLQDATGQQAFAQILVATVSIMTSPNFSSADGNDDDAEAEIGYDAVYSGLTFARKRVEDPFASITNPSAALATALQQLSASKPGVLGPLIQTGFASDPKSLLGFQNMCQTAGVNLS